MIRRLSKNQDYIDIIKSCPSGVIDDIYSIKYFISGHPETEVEASFTKKGNLLEVILPTSQLAELGNGLLMRRSLYSNVDPAFPDGQYNLEFVEDLNVWLGDEEVDPPFDNGYLTADDLKTINGDSIVGVGNIDVVSYIPSYYVTESWISSQNFATVTYVQNIISSVESGILTDLSSYATMSWVSEQGYLTVGELPSNLATQSWVEDYVSGNYLTTSDFRDYSMAVNAQFSAIDSALSTFATESWVLSQGYITSTGLSGLATQSWVQDYVSGNYLTISEFRDYSMGVNAQFSTVESALSSYATQYWVEQGYVTTSQLTAFERELGDVISNITGELSNLSSIISGMGYDPNDPFATVSYVDTELGYIRSDFDGFMSDVNSAINDVYSYIDGQGFAVEDPNDPFATMSWVNDVTSEFIISDPNDPFATESYVTSALSGYATESFVTDSLSSYATHAWVSGKFLEESKVWTGSFTDWIQLTSSQQAFYTIALIIE